jgi:hypothetical protein
VVYLPRWIQAVVTEVARRGNVDIFDSTLSRVRCRNELRRWRRLTKLEALCVGVRKVVEDAVEVSLVAVCESRCEHSVDAV